jgi:hypothetical protein
LLLNLRKPNASGSSKRLVLHLRQQKPKGLDLKRQKWRRSLDSKWKPRSFSVNFRKKSVLLLNWLWLKS